ncbi:MAG: hypothetical protein M3472_00490, partial [Chloroflexota bacterium]|nr:hypothetical protein [Chloroflexota bacterium]
MQPLVPGPSIDPAPRLRVSVARSAFASASVLYVGAVFIQVFLAGMTIFAGFTIEGHRNFAHVFAVLGLVQLVALAFARVP